MYNTLLSVIIPVYQAEATLIPLYNRLTKHLDSLVEKYQLIFVNDASTDLSGGILNDLSTLHGQTGSKISRLILITLQENQGQQYATREGIRSALSSSFRCETLSEGLQEYFVTLDDDLQYEPELIGDLLYSITQNRLQIVYGIPNIRSHKLYRRFGSQCIDFALQISSCKPAAMKVSSFRIMTAELAERIARDVHPKPYISAIVFQQPVKAGMVTIDIEHNKHRNSRYTLSSLSRVFLTLVITYTPIKIKNSCKRLFL